MDINLTERDYTTLMSALIKVRLLNGWVQAGLDVKLTPKNFGFIEMTNEEEWELVQKLYANAQIAWLKESRNGKNEG
jgi:hypothetical protein